jgi:hypothetical protein
MGLTDETFRLCSAAPPKLSIKYCAGQSLADIPVEQHLETAKHSASPFRATF